ncbi:leucine-rich repeat protein [Clostridium puniceum]|uniref:leucine-rich repeat protein n=1 Tax=Clostridium puniceum TaxID=29367 RepID=UPI003BFA72C0
MRKIVVLKEIDGIKINQIYAKAFYTCTNLKSITIQNNITHISISAFDGCKNLENIIVNDDNTKYSSVNRILLNKTKTELIRCLEGKKDSDYAIPDSVITLEWYAFEDCYSLPSISIPNNVKGINKDSFEKKSNTILYVNIEEMKQDLILGGIDTNKIIVNS